MPRKKTGATVNTKTVPMSALDRKKQDKLLALREVMEEINAEKDMPEFSKLHFADEETPRRRISTGILALDIVMGGTVEMGFGFPRGGMVQLTAPESCFKTSALLHTVAKLQRESAGVVVWGRAERFDKKYAAKMGVDVSKVILVPLIQNGDKGLDRIIKLILTGAVDMGVIDSLQGVRTTREMEEVEMGEGGYGNGAPQMWSQALVKIASAQAGPAAETAMVWTSQARSKIGGKAAYGDNIQGTQIRAVGHWKDIDVRFRRADALYKKGLGIYGRTFGVKADKQKTATPERVGEFEVRLQPVDGPVGIDYARMVLTAGMETEVIQRAGAWYTVDGKRYNGQAPLLEAIREDDGLERVLIEAIYETMSE